VTAASCRALRPFVAGRRIGQHRQVAWPDADNVADQIGLPASPGLMGKGPGQTFSHGSGEPPRI
jgi:hypothetical protein